MSKILIVADDARLLESYGKSLGTDFQVELAKGANDALSFVKQTGPFGVIVADHGMRGVSGLDFLAQVHLASPRSVRILLVQPAEVDIVNEAVNEGYVARYLVKPCSALFLRKALHGALRQFRASVAEQELLEQSLEGSIRMLTDILSMVHPKVFGRTSILRERARVICEVLQVDGMWGIEVAAMLSQVGMVTLPPTLLQKAEARMALSGTEKDMVQRVPEIGANLLMNVPKMETVANTVRYVQKTFDGGGHPHDGVSGTDIPLGSRILKLLIDLADWEERGVSVSKALLEMRELVGRYDPKLLETATKCFTAQVSVQVIDRPDAVKIKFAELHLGHILISDLVTETGMLLVKGGQLVSKSLLERISNFATITQIKEPIYVQKEGWR